MGFYTQKYHCMQISARERPLMDVSLDATKSTWAVESVDEAWVLNAALKQPKPNFNSNKR